MVTLVTLKQAGPLSHLDHLFPKLPDKRKYRFFMDDFPGDTTLEKYMREVKFEVGTLPLQLRAGWMQFTVHAELSKDEGC